MSVKSKVSVDLLSFFGLFVLGVFFVVLIAGEVEWHSCRSAYNVPVLVQNFLRERSFRLQVGSIGKGIL